MKKMNYECPEFSFNEMKLAERVADVCWGLGHAYLDVDGDGAKSGADLEIDFGSGCSGKDAATAMNNWFVNYGMENPNYSANVCNTQTPGLIASGS